jgi:AcrR family transcriptional regulator
MPDLRPPRSSDDPRARRTRQAALDAARAILLDEGHDRVTHARVAARSGVGRATLYRHWPDRARLLIDVLVTTPRPRHPPLGDLRAELLDELGTLSDELARSPFAPILATLVERSEWDAEMRARKLDLVDRAGEGLRQALGRAVARGELPGDLDAARAVATLVGPLFFRRFLSNEPITPELAAALVDDFLRARR